jgi:hypothetical protein
MPKGIDDFSGVTIKKTNDFTMFGLFMSYLGLGFSGALLFDLNSSSTVSSFYNISWGDCFVPLASFHLTNFGYRTLIMGEVFQLGVLTLASSISGSSSRNLKFYFQILMGF